jgi:adenine phosphoribosyltransferase
LLVGSRLRPGGEIYEAGVIIDLPELNGSKMIKEKYGVDVYAICEFEGT